MTHSGGVEARSVSFLSFALVAEELSRIRREPKIMPTSKTMPRTTSKPLPFMVMPPWRSLQWCGHVQACLEAGLHWIVAVQLEGPFGAFVKDPVLQVQDAVDKR